MTDRPRPFEDVQTVEQRQPPGYEATTMRRRLEIAWSDANGAHTATLDSRTVIGSAQNANLVVADAAVSRIHAEIEVRADGVWLRDLGSRNGTFIEGVQVALARVPDGGRLRVGSTVLTVNREATPTKVDLWPSDRFGPLIGRSAIMRELFAKLARIAATDSTVLIQGETGTGKELVARAIHDASPRAAEEMVIVDCAALPENLLESELFGHAKGAFTGASNARAGAIESADKGTVFLDEIGELPLSMQPKLLRAIESKTVRRLGESNHRKVDVRFLTATHRDLQTMVNKGAFREDLFFRLSVIPITIPPLRDRTEDITQLVSHFVPPGSASAVGPELIAEITTRPWLGNVRELRNFIERVLALGAREALVMSKPKPASANEANDELGPLAAAFDKTLPEARELWMDRLEREYIRRLLEKHDRNVNAVASEAGVNRTYVYRLIRKHDL